jgi:hypothetical protein
MIPEQFSAGAIAAEPHSKRRPLKLRTPVNLICWPHARARAVVDSAAADFYFAIIRVRGRPGSSPIGAIAAAPASYRVIAKLRHRKLSAIGPRLTQLVGLSRARGLWRIRPRRISISRLSDRRRGGPAAW